MASITTTFDTNAGGWTISGDVASRRWVGSGGDPGSYYSWVDAATGPISYFDAPRKYLGNKSAYYGGSLSYAILDTGNGLSAYDVQLVGGGITLQYTSKTDASFPKLNKWSSARLYLIPSRFIDTSAGHAPSAAELKATLGDLTGLAIRAEYVDGAESGGLDDVVLAKKPTTTGAAQLVQAAAVFSVSDPALANQTESAQTVADHFELAPPAPLGLGARLA